MKKTSFFMRILEKTTRFKELMASKKTPKTEEMVTKGGKLIEESLLKQKNRKSIYVVYFKVGDEKLIPYYTQNKNQKNKSSWGRRCDAKQSVLYALEREFSQMKFPNNKFKREFLHNFAENEFAYIKIDLSKA